VKRGAAGPSDNSPNPGAHSDETPGKLLALHWRRASALCDGSECSASLLGDSIAAAGGPLRKVLAGVSGGREARLSIHTATSSTAAPPLGVCPNRAKQKWSAHSIVTATEPPPQASRSRVRRRQRAQGSSRVP